MVQMLHVMRIDIYSINEFVMTVYREKSLFSRIDDK